MMSRHERKVELREELIAVLDKIKKINPNQKLIVETPNGTVSLNIGDALIYDDPNGVVVVDAE